MTKNRKKYNIFKAICWTTAALCIYLFYTLMFDSKTLLMDLEVEQHESALFALRRASIFFLGLAVLAFWGGKSAHSAARQAIALSIGVVMAGLAAMGGFELARGFVGTGILGAMAVELFVAASFFGLWLTNRRASEHEPA